MLGPSPESRLGAALQFLVIDVAKVFVLVMAIVYLIGLLRRLMSPERMRALVRGRPDCQTRSRSRPRSRVPSRWSA